MLTMELMSVLKSVIDKEHIELHQERKDRVHIGGFLLKKLHRFLVLVLWVLLTSLVVLYSVQPVNKFTNNKQAKRFQDEVSPFHDVFGPRDSPDDTRLLSLFNNSVHLYSANAHNNTADSFYDVIHVSGWENRPVSIKLRYNYTCCLLYDQGGSHTVVGTKLRAKHEWSYVGKALQEVKQFLCGNVLSGRRVAPIAVTLDINRQCPKDFSKYIKVDLPQRHPGHTLGVCAKLIYGTIDPISLVEWFEYQRYMGVSKVVSYTHNLSSEATAVLNHYREQGLSEHYPFDVPMINGVRRGVGVKNFQGWNDEQVAAFDCHGKLAGYKYIGLYDVDEYILPTKHTNLVQLMDSLKSTHPRSAGFTFKTEVFALTWGADNSSEAVNDITIERYTLRTEPMRDRVKSVVISARVLPGRLYTHGYWPRTPYKKTVVGEDMAVLKHYRTCRKEWMKKNGEKCFKTITKYRDTSMLPIASKIRDRVNSVKRILNLH